MILGLMSWEEHRYILLLLIVALTVGAHYIASYSLKELDDAMQYNHKKKDKGVSMYRFIQGTATAGARNLNRVLKHKRRQKSTPKQSLIN